MITHEKIGVLAGGTSAEREVSLRSGRAVHKALTDRGYAAVFIDTADDLYRSLTTESIGIAFIALHGGHGENGAVQGFLEVLGIPYTGSGILASALAMDKEASKKLFTYHGVPVPPFAIINRFDPAYHAVDAASISASGVISFGLPWVIKPANEGSSIGVHIVRSAADVQAALDDAFSFGDTLIIEQYVKGKEIQIGILGDRALGGVEVRPSTEFYNYEAKYTPGLTRYILPPEISDDNYAALKKTALVANRALGCTGATRVDLILDEAHRPYVLEVNTIPGMTETSLLPKIAGLAGLSFGALIEEIIGLALAVRR